ncbi:probable inactive ribonuclease-like protein 13 [Lepus europaeus]|uniref:probable inactive ribonuclease-like protein 13 n=1 Tax=Lepus europaeus TaxID=9983 RepID=UPI002B494260|nr:probable inactive ribonuclease-like protein 13 [Lepus europaeus]
MAAAVARLLFFQLFLGPALSVDINLQSDTENFRTLYIDYPKVKFIKGFLGYCNGMMAYVRGRIEHWYCPKTHYVIHAPWKAIQKSCKASKSFCENYNKYCTLTQDSFPVTVCSLGAKQPSTSCRYNSTLTNKHLYLLCSGRYDAEPIGIVGLY